MKSSTSKTVEVDISERGVAFLLLRRLLRTAAVGFVLTLIGGLAFTALAGLALNMASSKMAIESDFSKVVTQLDRLNSSK
ncbi:MAG: hypothetical protein K2W95_23475 [Candidatus Obscuribacterales bacterium]|nr:hypothetical protein [Candidatus Obscuribacterales bacterium]